MKASIINNNQVLLEATKQGDRDLIAALDNIRGYEDNTFMINEYDRYKGRKVRRKKTTRKKYKVLKTSSDFSRAMYHKHLHDPVVATMIYSGLVNLEGLEIPNNPMIRLSKKWEDILRDYQIQALLEVIKRDNGVAKLHTGAGKLEMALALIESYKEISDKKILVLVPTNSIRDEWGLRMKKWDVDHSNIFVINPVGVMRRKNLPELLENYKNPGLVVSDEVHHMQAKSWLAFLEAVGSSDYNYGFSATPEVKGQDIKEASDLLGKEYPIAAYRLATAAGPVRAERFPHERDKSVEIHILSGRFSDEYVTPDDTHYVELVEKTITSSVITNVITQDLLTDPEMKLYIPVITKTSGLALATQYASRGIPAIYWDSEKALLVTSRENPKLITGLDEIKKLVSSGDARVLITTSLSYEGVDLPSLNSVLLVHGKNDRMILQPLGRSARGGHTKVYIVKDHNNPAIKNQANRRLYTIKKQYQVSGIVERDFD